MTIEERELICTDRFVRLTTSRVQTVRKATIPPRMEVAFSCRLASHNHAPERLNEGLSDKVVLANIINRPGAKGNVIVRCINSTNQPLELAAGLTMETFTSINKHDVTNDGERQPGFERCTPTTSKVLDPVEAMF